MKAGSKCCALREDQLDVTDRLCAILFPQKAYHQTEAQLNSKYVPFSTKTQSICLSFQVFHLVLLWPECEVSCSPLFLNMSPPSGDRPEVESGWKRGPLALTCHSHASLPVSLCPDCGYSMSTWLALGLPRLPHHNGCISSNCKPD